ncbi:MAG TPA: hypothetical protein VIX87_02110 [Steroidobacteraceae bacterium]
MASPTDHRPSSPRRSSGPALLGPPLRLGIAVLCALVGLALGGTGAWADEDDEGPPPATVDTAHPALSAEQQEAVGLTVLHPLPAKAGEQIDGYGEVLDPGALIADAGRLQSTRAAERAAGAEAQRLEGLYRGAAEASLKSVEGAQAVQIEAHAQARAASAAFTLQWGPLVGLQDAQLAALLDALTSGRSMLIRADLPGRLRLGAIPQTAELDLDGTKAAGRVLGTLAHSASDSQTVGLLLQIEHPPAGLGIGARMRVTLQGAQQGGVLVPASALLYGEQGAYVYRRLSTQDKQGRQQYTPVPIKLIQAAGTAWLVQGIDADDLIVATGAGVLWSLQGLGSFSAEEEDHD